MPSGLNEVGEERTYYDDEHMSVADKLLRCVHTIAARDITLGGGQSAAMLRVRTPDTDCDTDRSAGEVK